MLALLTNRARRGSPAPARARAGRDRERIGERSRTSSDVRRCIGERSRSMRLATEEAEPRFADLDAWPLASAMEAMWEGQLAAVASVGRALPAITAATNAAKDALRERGRLIYVGAGTSARVAIQDGAELKPTFGWPEKRLHFVIAGGERAFATSVEGAEDD